MIVSSNLFYKVLDLEFPKNCMFLSIRNIHWKKVYVPCSFRAISTAGTCVKVKTWVLNFLIASMIFFFLMIHRRKRTKFYLKTHTHTKH